jgi:hypothetical protein
MNLDEAQKRIVAGWIAEGLKLSDIQKKLGTDLGVHMTYMEVRLLVDDLKLTPKDVEPPQTTQLSGPAAAGPAASPAVAGAKTAKAPGENARGTGTVSVAVDQLARPGAMVSGKVTFSDGKRADWYLDDLGRLGVSPEEQGYRPSQKDLQAFQAELQRELGRFGY